MYVQSDTLIVSNLQNINMSHKIYEIDPARFLTAPGLAWQAALKKTKIKLDLLTDIDTLLLVEKGIRGRICHAIHMQQLITNT